MNMLLTNGFSVLKMPRGFRPMTDDEFFYYCQENPDHKFERAADGTIIVTGQTGGETGKRNSELNADLAIWNRSTKLGFVFDSSTGFILPNSAVRSPDAAWVTAERWNALSSDERKKFPPLCPEFLVEFMSESDVLRMAEDKMREYIDNGCRLAWLIDPKTETVRIYRFDGSVQVIQGFDNTLSGKNILPDFTFNLSLLR
ncbi:Uma2 family endonuclease [Larkinella humicola]|uniref:Uma2 family endonuclease n=1 Tax=Larkinella humicola TaxID=2607654 RepID=A0A5N1JDY4_9BACT|nr:Uma2 family endonuclease [Larkinella humicola]KAA9349934.1 Uma2 family endonuclease [Larkinella humicola]